MPSLPLHAIVFRPQCDLESTGSAVQVLSGVGMHPICTRALHSSDAIISASRRWAAVMPRSTAGAAAWQEVDGLTDASSVSSLSLSLSLSLCASQSCNFLCLGVGQLDRTATYYNEACVANTNVISRDQGHQFSR